MNEWYARHLGLPVAEYGTLFKWRDADNPNQERTTVWATFGKDTDYFAPSAKEFMINYRVEQLEELVEQLKRDGITMVDEITVYEQGKFVHILDPEGNKIELWEEIR
jgi:lactoylglutathione lyase